jgi:hypothetical protein
MGLTHSRGPPLTNEIYHEFLLSAVTLDSLVKIGARYQGLGATHQTPSCRTCCAAKPRT